LIEGLVLHFDAKWFQQSAVLNSAGAGGFAASAIEAGIEMSADGGGEFESAIDDGSHQVNSASRAIIFVAGFDVGGAGSRAKSTVDTVEEPIVGNGLPEF
jgi:hypothetical protein